MKTLKFTLMLLGLGIATASPVHAQKVTVTIAGTGVAGYGGDGGYGKYADINQPHDVCMDAAGNIYFTDQANGRIRKISGTTGMITTVAGGGTSSADGVPALSALLLAPKYMCVDASGNLFVAEYGTNQIKRIDAVTHLINTVAGTGAPGYSGDGGYAISATFNGLLGICADAASNIYVVDSGNNRIRKISGGIVTTIAGTGTAGYTGDGSAAAAATINSPSAITANAAGDVFFMDQSAMYSSVLRKITASTGIITTIAGTPTVGGGPIFGSTLATTWFGYVTGLCMDGDGNFFCNEISCSCRKIDLGTDTCYAVGGDFSVESYSDELASNIAYMNNPYGICTDAAKSVYVADKYNNRIRKIIQLTHTPTFAFGQGSYLHTCPGSTTNFESMLAVTDMDASQTETYTLLTPPAHGTVSGFPATATSAGTAGVARPSTGLSYTSSSTYIGSDQFQVQVSDGALTSVFTVNIDNGVASITGAATVCAGATTSLADQADGGTWTVANANATISATGVVTAVTPGTDIAYYTVTNSCGTMTTQRSITINTVPDAGAIVTPATVCKGATITATDAAASVPGTWVVSNPHTTVSASGIITGVSVGTDTLLYIVSNTCGSTEAKTAVSVTDCSGLGVANVAATAPDIFPNPASSALNIRWDGLLAGKTNISIADVTGRVVMSNETGGNGTNTAVINVSGLKEGIYLLTINSGKEYYTSKVTINK